MQNLFISIADHAVSLLKGDEVINLSFEGEDSDFVRFNHNGIRQPGSVRSCDVGIDLIRGQTHAQIQVALTGIAEADQARVKASIEELRARLDHIPEDPHLLYATNVNSTERKGEDQLPDRDQAIGAILRGGAGKDLVGIYAQGPIYRGFANNLGQRNWFESRSFNFDYSLYLRDDKAVKSAYAGFKWDDAEFNRKLAEAGDQLELLNQEAKTIPRGKYRAYFSPAAINEIAGTLSWMGFGLKNHRSKISSLIKMTEGDETVNPAVTMSENTAEGIAPNFDGKGFIKPDKVVMIDGGKFRDALVSPRTAKEYGEETNAAEGEEWPLSFDMAGGDLRQDEILQKLGTGAYINNLHYLNYSDRAACRITGMTRFATFWVENGRIVAPLNVMRFDESFYRMFGENLIALTKDREMILSNMTYGGRQVSSARLPGALVEAFAFTL
ncbi:MAG: TldE/PmbA family protein [Candidatus Eisenbacteria bacterium]|uniref:TldE/PmbA family protein n=1 Tax=Eiseniibacteriota bacterium TaxID=2212470 RepID=A0A948S3H7_UNCEI|nr:TldE/PmbA family protein [Candidatus Eisenbacteria bacterium]MBU1948939.1 TldE/PmbA family protein [Candidatus Eisenbacteria bacterium]MBU2693124.1 TldE/PmbA family protein [Candidatus Eisenbacteria bacterium]